MKFDKSYIRSKTLWVALIVALSGFFPEVQELVKENPEYVGMAIGGVFGFLRFITRGKVVMKEERGIQINHYMDEE